MSVHHQGFPIRDEKEIPLLQRVVRRCGGSLIILYLVALGPIVPLYWPILFSSLLLWTKPMYMRRIFDFSLATWMHVVAVSLGSARDTPCVVRSSWTSSLSYLDLPVSHQRTSLILALL